MFKVIEFSLLLLYT